MFPKARESRESFGLVSLETTMETLLTGREAAAFMGIAEQTLRIARITGTGAKFVKVGRSVRYRKSDIEAYLASRTYSNTSQMGGAI